jgi:hypothetical protein
MSQTYGESINLPLSLNEVIVFGSNLSGFHGAGVAGLATFGVMSLTLWKTENYSAKPTGWKGLYNIKGQAEGLQKGTVGESYALPTIIKPGWKKSLSLEKIRQNIEELYRVALENPDKKFLVAYQNGGKNLNGYSSQEMADVFLKDIEIPPNILFSDSFWKLK